jgi:transglutaminase-like putative cysteine protease
LNSIFLFVRDEVEFGFAPKGDLVKASETIEQCYGQCNNKGILFLALCKAAGFKARFHSSTVSKEIQKGIFTDLAYWLIPNEISHGWVEVEINGQWYSIDSYINDLPFHRVAMRELKRRGWKSGFSVSQADGKPSAELVLDDAHFSQMGAVTGDHGTWEQPVEYLASSAYLNRLGPFGSWLYRLALPLINGRIRRLRAQGQIAEAA